MITADLRTGLRVRACSRVFMRVLLLFNFVLLCFFWMSRNLDVRLLCRLWSTHTHTHTCSDVTHTGRLEAKQNNFTHTHTHTLLSGNVYEGRSGKDVGFSKWLGTGSLTSSQYCNESYYTRFPQDDPFPWRLLSAWMTEVILFIPVVLPYSSNSNFIVCNSLIRCFSLYHTCLNLSYHLVLKNMSEAKPPSIRTNVVWTKSNNCKCKISLLYLMGGKNTEDVKHICNTRLQIESL